MVIFAIDNDGVLFLDHLLEAHGELLVVSVGVSALNSLPEFLTRRATAGLKCHKCILDGLGVGLVDSWGVGFLLVLGLGLFILLWWHLRNLLLLLDLKLGTYLVIGKLIYTTTVFNT